MPSTTKMIKMLPEDKFRDFIDQHHVMHLATSIDNTPYMAQAFYVYNPEDNQFIITSSMDTKHAEDITHNSKVAVGIALETKTVGKIQGLQIQAEVEIAEGEALKKAKKLYLKEYPYALLHIEKLWIIKPYFMKLTDNRLGFGKKLKWGKAI